LEILLKKWDVITIPHMNTNTNMIILTIVKQLSTQRVIWVWVIMKKDKTLIRLIVEKIINKLVGMLKLSRDGKHNKKLVRLWKINQFRQKFGNFLRKNPRWNYLTRTKMKITM